MEKLFSLGHTVAFDWIKDRDAPPLIIQLKFQSDWANLIGTECLHGMILIKSAFDPNHFLVRASMSIHGRVQNQKLATETEILGLTVRRTSITFQVIVDATLLKWKGFASQESWQNATACRLQHTFVAVLSLARHHVVFFCIPAHAKAKFLFAFSNRNWNGVNFNVTPLPQVGSLPSKVTWSVNCEKW